MEHHIFMCRKNTSFAQSKSSNSPHGRIFHGPYPLKYLEVPHQPALETFFYCWSSHPRTYTLLCPTLLATFSIAISSSFVQSSTLRCSFYIQAIVTEVKFQLFCLCHVPSISCPALPSIKTFLDSMLSLLSYLIVMFLHLLHFIDIMSSLLSYLIVLFLHLFHALFSIMKTLAMSMVLIAFTIISWLMTFDDFFLP